MQGNSNLFNATQGSNFDNKFDANLRPKSNIGIFGGLNLQPQKTGINSLDKIAENAGMVGAHSNFPMTKWQSFKNGANRVWEGTKNYTKNQMDENKGGFGAANYISSALNAAGTISNMVLGHKQMKLAQEQMKADQAQRELENKRYDAQMKRIEDATNDASSTATNLKSAQSNMSENAEAQNETKDLPMDRE